MARHSVILHVAVLLTFPVGASQSHAAGSDNSANSAYAAETGGAWKGLNPSESENPPGTDNGGSGFMGWDFGGGYHVAEASPYANLNHFIDGVDFPHSTYNDLGPTAFGLTTAYAPFFGTYASAKRPFAQALAIGETFSASIDTPSIYDDYSGFAYPFAIIAFQDASGEETLKIETGSSAQYGDFPWRYSDAGNVNADFGAAASTDPIAPTATSDGSALQLKATSATGGELTLDGVTVPVQFIGGLPVSVVFALNDNGSGDNYESGGGLANGQREFFFDDLTISSGGPAIPGDFDGDGNVDGDDLTQWKGDFGINGDSDADDDDDSDGNDLLIWQRNLGEPNAVPLASAIPEPTGALSLSLAVALTVIRNRCRVKPPQIECR